MKNPNSYIKIFISVVTLLTFAQLGYSQVEEPDLREGERIATDLGNLYNKGISFNIVVNNFGLGLGGDFRRVVSPQTEMLATVRFAGVRDVTEQTFTSFFGQQVVPNKYKRAFAFPLLVGLRHRLFGDRVQDNYRFFVSAMGGPVAAFTYPYFDDANNNDYRETGNEYELFEQDGELFISYAQSERVNDIFTGWSEGDWHWGAAGEVKLGMDIGSNFSRLTSVEFGYYFNYFPDGIQVMQPNQPDLRENVPPGESPFQFNNEGEVILEPFSDAQKWFGTPQITLTFGKLW
ncbi:MAG: hypothetical protein WD381_02025 [Balneolaceae bacterium]